MKDTFRKVYKPLSEDSDHLIKMIKESLEVVEDYMSRVKSREMSLALTNLEQASMWATKAVVLEDGKFNSDA